MGWTSTRRIWVTTLLEQQRSSWFLLVSSTRKRLSFLPQHNHLRDRVTSSSLSTRSSPRQVRLTWLVPTSLLIQMSAIVRELLDHPPSRSNHSMPSTPLRMSRRNASSCQVVWNVPVSTKVWSRSYRKGIQWKTISIAIFRRAKRSWIWFESNYSYI